MNWELHSQWIDHRSERPPSIRRLTPVSDAFVSASRKIVASAISSAATTRRQCFQFVVTFKRLLRPADRTGLTGPDEKRLRNVSYVGRAAHLKVVRLAPRRSSSSPSPWLRVAGSGSPACPRRPGWCRSRGSAQSNRSTYCRGLRLRTTVYDGINIYERISTDYCTYF